VSFLPESGSRVLKAIKFAWVEARRDKVQQHVLLVGAVMSLVLLALFTRSVREAGQAQAVVPSDISGHPLVLPLRDLLHEVDDAALHVRQQWRQTGSLPLPEELEGRSAALRGLIERVDILGADGRPVASSQPLPSVPVYLGGEDDFRLNQTSPQDRIFISRDPASPDSPLTPFRFGRSITGHDGAFQGMVVLSLDTTQLAIHTTSTPDPDRWPIRWLESAGWAALLLTLLAGLAHIIRLLRERNAFMGTLEVRRNRADASSRLKSDWVASVSHEVRTPLNGIMGFAELVGQARSLGEAREHARVIHASAQHLNEIASTLLDLSRLEAGQLTVRPERIDLREMVEDVFALHRVTARQKNLDTSLQIASDAPDHIVTDRTRLTQVLHNLLHNAVKFTDQGKVICEIGHDGTRWQLTVQDTGIGMDQAQMAHLFERFNNIPLDTAHHDMQGAGLGMALAREVITLLGGDIHIQSSKGHGTRVHLTLPDLSQEARHAQPPPPDEDGAAAAAAASTPTH
jgi:signal transduction histidine kinase